jgi:hypothetical protein
MQILHLKKGMQIALITIADEHYVRVGNTLPTAPFVDMDGEVWTANNVDVYLCAESEDLLTDPSYNLRDIHNYLYALVCDDLPDYLIQSPSNN